MKRNIFRMGSVLTVALLLTSFLTVAVFAEEAGETEIPMEYPLTFADSETAVYGITTLEDYVDLGAFTNYVLEHMAQCKSLVDISAYAIPSTTQLQTEI